MAEATLDYQRNSLDLSPGEIDTWSPQEILTWAIGKFHPRLALSCSFGNPEGLVLLDMMHRIEPSSRVYVLDTGRLPQATYDLIDRVRDRYDKHVEVVFPDAEAVQAMVRRDGMNLFYESLEKRRLCCALRKVEPNRRYLAGLDAYVTGLRREPGRDPRRGATPRDRRRRRRPPEDQPPRRLDRTTTSGSTCAITTFRSTASTPRASRASAAPLHARREARRRPARRPLVVGERRDEGVRPPRRRRGRRLGDLAGATPSPPGCAAPRFPRSPPRPRRRRGASGAGCGTYRHRRVCP